MFVFVLLFVALSGFAFAADCKLTPEQEKNELARYIAENYTKREVSIPVRDGVKLFTSITSQRINRKNTRFCSIARLTRCSHTAKTNAKRRSDQMRCLPASFIFSRIRMCAGVG